MQIRIRLEEENDFRNVEELTREAFWNVYMPGASEHYLAHKMRESEDFIWELDFVAEVNGQPAGSILYTKSKVVDEQGIRHSVITFGPLSVLPEFQKNGIGTALVHFSIEQARKEGHSGIVIYGNPAFYKRFGFRPAAEYGISRSDGVFAKSLLALELKEGALAPVKGRFFESDVFAVDEEEFEAYEKTFPYKAKRA